MPVYEYRCEQCGRKNILFKPSLAEAEAAAAELKCERCGSGSLRRLFSRFSLGRAAASEGEELYEFDRMTAGLDENEPRQLAKWAESLGGEPAEETGNELEDSSGEAETPPTGAGKSLPLD